MTHYTDPIREKGPYPPNQIRRIWIDRDDLRIHVILTSSGFHRFSVAHDHPHYSHYTVVLSMNADDAGWVTRPVPPPS